MRRSLFLAGFVVALAATGSAYLLYSNTGSLRSADTAAVAPGFVGASVFGDWSLICTPAAESALVRDGFDAPEPATAGQHAESACRIRHEAKAPAGDAAAPNEPPRVILTVSLSLVGPARSPALMLRLPPTLSAGQAVTIRSPEDFSFEILARDCSEDECLAAASLSDEQWRDLIDAGALQVVFPIDESQLVSVDVSTNGFAAAVAALEAAQPATP